MRIGTKNEVTYYVIQSTDSNGKIEYLASNAEPLSFDSDFHSAEPLTKYGVYHVLDRLSAMAFPNSINDFPRKLSIITLTKSALCTDITTFAEDNLKDYQ